MRKVAGKEEGDREKPGRNVDVRGERGEQSIGRIYICMSAEGTMYSNCKEKGCNLPQEGYIGDR